MTVIERAIQKLRDAPLGGENIYPSLTYEELNALICAAEFTVAMKKVLSEP